MKLALLALVVALSCGCIHRASVSPTQPTIDVLDFIIGEAGLWPRIGTQAQNQVVDDERREICWT